MSPLRLTDSQITAVFAAARPLAGFLKEVASLPHWTLAMAMWPRAIRAVQRKHFDPPETDERQEPHPRRMRAR